MMDVFNEDENTEIDQPDPQPVKNNRNRKLRPRLWTFGAVLSIVVNVILIVVVLVLGNQLFSIKETLTSEVFGGLYYNFLLMDQAEIKTSIEVEDSLPVQFDLPLNQNTTVVLSEDTKIDGVRVTVVSGSLHIIDAPASIVLPEGTELPVNLNLVVPVDQQVPVELTVPVEIPMSDTELHEPFVGLQEVVSPYYLGLIEMPNTWKELRCQYIAWGCEE
ncbi:MAG: hypothetical protein ABFS17_08895 [Chloroflexota bacterium]